jgi:uncharacterized membrane protein
VDRLSLHLTLHGLAVLTFSVFAGLVLWRILDRNRGGADWHLVHASGTVRGVLLIALAAIIDLPALPEWLVATAVWLIIWFTWTSVIAMTIRAVTGERGFSIGGSNVNRLVFGLYAVGAFALFPACAILITGMLRSLWL